MVTLGALVTDVKARLDESGLSRAWPNVDLRRWVMEGARDMARRSEVLQDTSLVEVTAGVNEYLAPADAIRIYRVLWKPTGDQTYPLEYQDFNSMDSAGWSWTNASGYPAVFTLWGYPPQLKIVVYPNPTTAGDLEIWYYRFPAELATDGTDDNTVVDLPTGWEDAVATYCEMVALRKDADQRWTESRALYEEKVMDLIDRTRRWTDQAGAIQHAGTWLPGWLYSPDAF